MGEQRVVNIRMDEYELYIGRGRGSKWSNPFQIGRDGDREEVIRKYKEWILRGEGHRLLRSIGELEGKTLGCFCAPRGGATSDDPLVCHGQILLKLVEHRHRKLIEKGVPT